MSLQQFDWDIAAKMHQPETLEFLKLNYDTPMSEETFVKIWSELPRNHRRATKSRSPHAARKIYRRLKTKFGFFGGTGA